MNTGETAYFRNHEGSYYDAMPSLWKNMSVPVRREVMCIIDRFFKEAPPGKSPWKRQNVLSLVRFFSHDEIPKIKIFHMVEMKHPDVIDGRHWLIDVDVIDSKEAAEDASINHDDAALYEEDGSGLVGAGVTEEVEDIQKALKYSSVLSYMLKPSHLLTQGFGNNRTAQYKIFKNMCNYGERSEWREEIRVVSSYLGVDTTKYQCRLLNPTPLDCDRVQDSLWNKSSV